MGCEILHLVCCFYIFELVAERGNVECMGATYGLNVLLLKIFRNKWAFIDLKAWLATHRRNPSSNVTIGSPPCAATST